MICTIALYSTGSDCEKSRLAFEENLLFYFCTLHTPREVDPLTRSVRSTLNWTTIWKGSRKGGSPLLKNAGFLLKEKYHFGERRYVNLGFMPSDILGPASNPAYRLFLSNHIFLPHWFHSIHFSPFVKHFPLMKFIPAKAELIDGDSAIENLFVAAIALSLVRQLH
jgi:hypothetical protein